MVSGPLNNRQSSARGVKDIKATHPALPTPMLLPGNRRAWLQAPAMKPIPTLKALRRDSLPCHMGSGCLQSPGHTICLCHWGLSYPQNLFCTAALLSVCPWLLKTSSNTNLYSPGNLSLYHLEPTPIQDLVMNYRGTTVKPKQVSSLQQGGPMIMG